MILTVIKFIRRELKEAEEYIKLAYEKKKCCPTTADLFITLAGEELSHADRLMKRGAELASKIVLNKDDKNYEEEHKRQVIWEWEKEQAIEEMNALRTEIGNFKTH